MKKILYAVVLFVLIVAAGIIAGIVNDEIRQSRNTSAAVKVENVNDINSIATSFRRVNTLSSLGEGYNVYLLSQEVNTNDTYISDFDPKKFNLEFIVDYTGIQDYGEISDVASMFGTDTKTSPVIQSQTKTLYVLICAPSGYNTADQVIKYRNEHYYLRLETTFAISKTDKAGIYTIPCQ